MSTSNEVTMQKALAESLAEFLKQYCESGEGKTAQAVAFQIEHKDGSKGTAHCLVLTDSPEDSALALEQIRFGPRDAEGKNAQDRTMSKWANSWLAKNNL